MKRVELFYHPSGLYAERRSVRHSVLPWGVAILAGIVLAVGAGIIAWQLGAIMPKGHVQRMEVP